MKAKSAYPPALAASLASSHPKTNGKTNGNTALISAMGSSRIYKEYENAFSETTGLPVSLCSMGTWQPPQYESKRRNPFCVLVAQNSRTCAACLQTQQRLRQEASLEPKTITCRRGMSESAVPLRMGEETIGFLQTGQIFQKPPTEAQFNKFVNEFPESKIEREKTKKAYFQTRVVPPKKYEAIMKLLGLFGQHLSMVCNQVTLQQKNSEPPVIVRAREFIKDHMAEDLTLGAVAQAAHVSPFYFCKIFKKTTGLTFTNYFSRIRVERAKSLLLNPNLRVSEIAYEVGFQSLTHFNRVFKKIVGWSPTQYRSKLPTATTA